VLLSRKRKEELVIQLDHESKTTREIAKQAHTSFKDIGTRLRKETGDDALMENEKQKKDTEGKAKTVSFYRHMLTLFNCSKNENQLKMFLSNLF
jgi:hypothetical protein